MSHMLEHINVINVRTYKYKLNNIIFINICFKLKRGETQYSVWLKQPMSLTILKIGKL